MARPESTWLECSARVREPRSVTLSAPRRAPVAVDEREVDFYAPGRRREPGRCGCAVMPQLAQSTTCHVMRAPALELAPVRVRAHTYCTNE